MADGSAGGWRWRLLVAEAAVRLALARFLVERVPLRYWRNRLGCLNLAGSAPRHAPGQTRILVLAVKRAAQRLPFSTKCLPRAMALQAMMRQRAIGGVLVIGLLDRSKRGTIEDLHAWIETEGEVLIGAVDQPFHPLIRFDWSK